MTTGDLGLIVMKYKSRHISTIYILFTKSQTVLAARGINGLNRAVRMPVMVYHAVRSTDKYCQTLLLQSC